MLSKDAADCMYEQSLFERIQKSCQSSVILLGTQYRMHPQISQFPSKIFYSGRLTDGMQMEVQCKASWHSDNRFAPYRFFNVTAGSESSSARGYSLFNLQEAKAIAQLFEYFCLAFGQNVSYNTGQTIYTHYILRWQVRLE